MKNLTPYFLIGLAIVALLFEFYTLIDKAPNNTISETIWRAIAGRPFIPFLVGFLCGHFFWQGYR
jgi:hypothetical protein